MPIYNSHTQEAGKRILQLCLSEFDVNSVMEACAIIAATLCHRVAITEKVDSVEFYAQLCEHALEQGVQNVINIADHRKKE